MEVIENTKRENIEQLIEILESDQALTEENRYEIADVLKKTEEKLTKNNAWFKSAGR